MARWRLLFYLVLNVFVSACTVTLVLYLWSQYNPLPAEPPLPPPATSLPATQVSAPVPSPTPEGAPTMALRFYEVQAGDTLGTIADQFGTSVDFLVQLNSLPDPNALGSGDTLLVPDVEAGSLAPLPSATPDSVTVPTPTPDSGEVKVSIALIIGSGVLEDERVIIQLGQGSQLPLAGWSLEDGDGNIYLFPQLTLYRGGAVSIYTRAGADSVVELYWGLDSPVWTSGETAVLRDPEGKIQATFTVP
ncbi:MAG TPA: LysM peptidoglycan-binding domain-containing protein [Anaerolineales bacterium]|nr:LysM peptidoglycan-binding domain-containing protein [Anaerolineales bacterium]